MTQSTQDSANATAFLTITGNVRGTGTFCVEGRVIGNVEVDTLIVAGGGDVQGNLKAATVEVRGKVVGNIAADSITVADGSHVRGDLNFEQIAIEAGSSFEGRCWPRNR